MDTPMIYDGLTTYKKEMFVKQIHTMLLMKTILYDLKSIGQRVLNVLH